MRRFVLLALVVTLSGCRSSRPAFDAEAARAALFDADRAFSAATQSDGLDGWMAFMAPDAARLPSLGDAPVRGPAAIRALDAALFADPAVRLVWEPAEAGVFADGRHGFTTGPYRVVRRSPSGEEEVLGTGSYLTWWRLDADGRWRVILDTGASDPPAGA